jgi:hypothetical protein
MTCVTWCVGSPGSAPGDLSDMLYVDVDALCKLAHWNILPSLSDITGHSWNNIVTMSSLRYRANRAMDCPDGKLFHSSTAAKLAHAYICKMGAPSELQSEILATLADSQQIDTGEALLLSMTANDSHGQFLTGDKRALRALSKLDCASLFVGRILIIEQIISNCLQNQGREWLLMNVCPYNHIDKAVSTILGSRCDGSFESIEAGIVSYIDEIAGLHNPSLLARL